MGKHALSSSSLHAGKQGRPPRASAALGRRPWASGTAGVRGKRGGATWEIDSLPRFGKMVARRGGSTSLGAAPESAAASLGAAPESAAAVEK